MPEYLKELMLESMDSFQYLYDFPEHEEYDIKMNLREFNMLHSRCHAMKQSQLDLQKSDVWEN